MSKQNRAVRTEDQGAYWRRVSMWYFAWILGLGFAVAILNAMWLEFDHDEDAT